MKKLIDDYVNSVFVKAEYLSDSEYRTQLRNAVTHGINIGSKSWYDLSNEWVHVAFKKPDKGVDVYVYCSNERGDTWQDIANWQGDIFANDNTIYTNDLCVLYWAPLLPTPKRK